MEMVPTILEKLVMELGPWIFNWLVLEKVKIVKTFGNPNGLFHAEEFAG